MKTKNLFPLLFWLIPALALAAPDRILFDFESGTYEGWTHDGADKENSPFGKTPADLTVDVPAYRADRQWTGWQGRFAVRVGDTRHTKEAPGRLISKRFTLDQPYLKFYLGAELHPRVNVSLWVDGRPVRQSYGNNSYDMRLRGWDVRAFSGQQGQLVIEAASDMNMLLRLDHFFLSDTPPPALDAALSNHAQEAAVARPGEYRLLWTAPAGEKIMSTSLLKGHDGRWHLFGALVPGEYNHAGKSLFHAVGDSPTSPFATVSLTAFTPAKDAGEAMVRDPYVLFHEGTYYLFYLGNGQEWTGWDPFYRWKEGYYGNSTQGPWGVYLATSKDGERWTRHDKNPLFIDTPFAFNPYVTKIGTDWVMYYAGTEPADIKTGRHAIIARTSPDLLNWGDRRLAMKSTHTVPWPEHSHFHSPVVFERNGDWWMFAGPNGNLNQSRFHYRQLFRSRDPGQWATPDKEVGEERGLFVEGGAKILRDENQRWWVTTSGVYSGGVWVAPLTWHDQAK